MFDVIIFWNFYESLKFPGKIGSYFTQNLTAGVGMSLEKLANLARIACS